MPDTVSTAAQETRVLILGASGMLGNAMLRFLASNPSFEVYGTVRSLGARRLFEPALADRLIAGVDAESSDSLAAVLAERKPDVVINCVGLVKQLDHAKDVLAAVPINTLLPHRLARLCQLAEARLIHFSTDCVFTGSKGGYRETDPADATDVYGLSKFLGEVSEPHTVTLRTSMIGHELGSNRSLVDWFLSQDGPVKGYRRAIFSGLPTVELARIVRDYVMPRPGLSGLYHVSAAPIAKYDLLRLVADAYGREVEIVPDDEMVIDRSLDSGPFRDATGYSPPSWPELVATMRRFG
jgi:dTDP-4-dehydrorhamnose reductase